MKNLPIVLFLGIFLVLSLPVEASKSKIIINSSSDIVNWKIKSQSEVGNDSAKILQPDHNTSGWVKADVPGTVFGSYVNAGLEKDPNFGDNAYTVDKSKYDRNFWYRTEINTS